MPSFNIKDYIIAIAFAALIGSGIYTMKLSNELNSKNELISQSVALASVQKEKIKLLKEKSRNTEEYLNEKYQVELTLLNNTVDGMRNDIPSASIMPSIPTSSTDPTGACFDREELNEAIQGYRIGVQGIIGKGATALIGLNISKEWYDTESKLYEFQ